MKCIFETDLIDAKSSKGGDREKTVIALNKIRSGYEEFVKTAIPTHKLDGSCSWVGPKGYFFLIIYKDIKLGIKRRLDR